MKNSDKSEREGIRTAVPEIEWAWVLASKAVPSALHNLSMPCCLFCGIMYHFSEHMWSSNKCRFVLIVTQKLQRIGVAFRRNRFSVALPIYENRWTCMQINENWWTSMNNNWNQWQLMNIIEHRWKHVDFMGNNENQWTSLNIDDNLWKMLKIIQSTNNQ